MNKGWILYIVGLVLILGLLMASYEHPENWTKTFSPKDKNPYGSYALNELAPDLFEDNKFEYANSTIYELLTAEDSSTNILSISTDFYPDETSLAKLLQKVSHGASAVISAEYIDYRLLDTLNISSQDVYATFLQQHPDSVFLYSNQGDTVSYVSHELRQALDSLPIQAEVLVYNQLLEPVAANIPFGSGKFTLCTTPILFSNFVMLYENNSKIPAQIISQLPAQERMTWTTYYQLGSQESSSPLREIIAIDPLRQVMYLSLFLVLCYLIIGSKRLQRAIPIIKSLPNQTVDFIKTVGLLHFHTQDHHGVALHRINYFAEYMRSNYRIDINHEPPEVMARKLNIDSSLMTSTMLAIGQIDQIKNMSSEQLISLNHEINNIYKAIRKD